MAVLEATQDGNTGKIDVPLKAEKINDMKMGMAPGRALTLEEIQSDELTKVANANWSSGALENKVPFDPELVKEIYRGKLEVKAGNKAVPLKTVMLLEISQYLESYLWPNFDGENSTFEHVFSVILLINEKFRENVSAFVGFQGREDAFPAFFKRVLTLKDEKELTIYEKINFVVFMINLFQSLENPMVREQVLQLVGLPLWIALSPGRRQFELSSQSNLLTLWQKLQKREAKAQKTKNPASSPFSRPQVKLIPSLLDEFLEILLNEIPKTFLSGEGSHSPQLLYCERFMEFLIDLLSQLPTRRFVRAVISDRGIVLKCHLSELYRLPQGALFSQLADLLKLYEGFQVDEQSGRQLSEEEVQLAHCEKWQRLQRLAFKEEPKLKSLALSNLAAVEKGPSLLKQLAKLTKEELQDLVCNKLHLVSPTDPWAESEDFLKSIMVSAYEKKRSQRSSLTSLPLYPNEEVMWDESVIPTMSFSGEGCLALPKLNLQFLTLQDYLLRNFNLFRLESTYEVRGDIEEAVSRVQAVIGEEEDVKFKGWARMAVKLDKLELMEVKAPLLGEEKPASVVAELTFSVGKFPNEVRNEWDELKEHDVLFLLSLAPKPEGLGYEGYGIDGTVSEREKYGVRYVRGCEIIEIRDEGHVLMNDTTGRIKPEDWRPPVGNGRTALVALDSAQYKLDLDRNETNLYSSFNLLLRRKAKENNFKPILESIRDLVDESTAIPPWLHDVFLGYGDPSAAHWKNLPAGRQLSSIDFKDTFLDAQHLRESFPNYEIQFLNEDGEVDEAPKPPFKVTLPSEDQSEKGENSGGQKRKSVGAEPSEQASEPSKSKILVESYAPLESGPYPQDQPKLNSVRFTPVQVEAILSGVQPGLTMVVGPPGTGKTDTAVQIMHVLYNNFPGQRILLITHSNQALNQLFEKIMERDIPARYLLRLGMGEKDLSSEEEFSRQGRVNTMLERRLHLLSCVERLAESLNLPADVAYTCETAAHFWLLRVLSSWEQFLAICEGKRDDPAVVQQAFPFTEYFKDAPNFKMPGLSYAEDMKVAQGCFRHLRTMFRELEECRAFELLKTSADRANYLMTRQARIVAMTCTHAALKRKDFLSLRFKYDSVVVEESAQILEIETFIPLVLQQAQDGLSRLKRVVLIGDHHQLPPVIQNMALQKYSHMDQSLFTRFIRLGIPYVELNKQGRARPSIAKLYNWRYRDLGDLPHVSDLEPYRKANAGFAFTYQVIDVPDYMGRGESEPNRWFYQNLGEAEYLISCFQYLRLLGYPAERISILTTYNGQKLLIRDVVKQRCSSNPFFGEPSRITTVDKFQGSQNDIVLLSLVRTKTVGHLRDVRRLIVAMSRAKLGLYIFCRKELFQQCYELQNTFHLLLQRPDKLALVLSEENAVTERLEEETGEYYLVQGLEDMSQIVARKYQQLMQHYAVEQTKPVLAEEGTDKDSMVKEMEGGEEVVISDIVKASKAEMAELEELAAADEEETGDGAANEAQTEMQVD